MLNNTKILHVEPTDACNAACPQCAREQDKSFNKSDLHHLSIEQINNCINIDQIKNLDKMFMCGDYGDPAAGKHTLEIFKYFRSINPTITLGMNTNGGLRSVHWWSTLGKILTLPTDYVVFSIDGLQDTNHIYRKNVNWNIVIRNVQSFINSGGNAHWEMLVFEHNQHQVNQAMDIAKELGFKWFRTKVSRRFNAYPVEFLQPPTQWTLPKIEEGVIKCHALNESSVYISAKGKVYPCCWLGVSNYTLDKFDIVKNSWSTTPNSTCSSVCTTHNTKNNFTNQWQLEVEF